MRYGSAIPQNWSKGSNCPKGDMPVAAMDRIVDRQINKARGILPFNSLLMAIITFENSALLRLSDHVLKVKISLLQTAVLYGLALSSILLLELFWVHWGKIDKKKGENLYAFFLTNSSRRSYFAETDQSFLILRSYCLYYP